MENESKKKTSLLTKEYIINREPFSYTAMIYQPGNYIPFFLSLFSLFIFFGFS